MTPEITHVAALGVLIVLALVVTVIDIHYLIIPNALNGMIFITGVTASLTLGVVDVASALIASALSAALLSLVQILFRIRRGYDGLGWGDVKFVAAAATWTGLDGFAPALLIASLSALLYVLGAHIANIPFDRQRRIPFGPFLALGVTIIAGIQILADRSITDFLDSWMWSIIGLA